MFQLHSLLAGAENPGYSHAISSDKQTPFGEKSGVKELDLPAHSINPIEHHWDELEWRLQAIAPDVTRSEWDQIPVSMFQHIVESFESRV